MPQPLNQNDNIQTRIQQVSGQHLVKQAQVVPITQKKVYAPPKSESLKMAIELSNKIREQTQKMVQERIISV